MVGLRQTEGAKQVACSQARQIAPRQLGTAEAVNGVHHQAGLHRQQRAERRVDPLDLARDQPIHDVAPAGTAIPLQRQAEHAEGAKSLYQRAIKAAAAETVANPRRQCLLRKARRRFADRPFFSAQLPLQVEGVAPSECHASGSVQDVADHHAIVMYAVPSPDQYHLPP